MIPSEKELMKHLLTKGEIVSSKRLAREFKCSIYEVANILKLLKKSSVVVPIRTRKWKVNKKVLKVMVGE